MRERPLTIVSRPLDQYAMARCENAERVFLALDYEGTLGPIALRPPGAKPSDRVLRILAALVQLPNVTVVVISDRSVRDLSFLLPVPGLAYVGRHGAELRMRSGELRFLVPPETFLSVMDRVQSDVLPLIGGIPGLTLERKQYAFTLHYRSATSTDSERVVQQFQAIIKTHKQSGFPLEVVHGKKVIEARPAAISKGKALCTLLAEADPLQFPLCLGDVTYEEAFREVNTRGVSVVMADHPQASVARYYLPNHDAVLNFLSQLVLLRRQKP